MGLNLESAQGAAAATLQVDRRNAGARQDRWMLELEKAFTESVEPQDAPSAKGRHAGAETAAQARTSESNRASDAAGARPVTDKAPADCPAAMAAAAATGVIWSSAGIALAPGGMMVAGASATLSNAGAVMRPTSAATLASVAPSVEPHAMVSHTTPRLFLSTGLNGNPAAQGALAAKLPEPSEAAAPDTRMPAEGKPFDKRAMHVFVDEHGVHAFIRDAALQSTQLRGLVQAVSAEVAAGGKLLASLTVNGRAIDQRRPSGDAHVFQQYADAESAVALHYPTQPAYKGNP